MNFLENNSQCWRKSIDIDSKILELMLICILTLKCFVKVYKSEAVVCRWKILENSGIPEKWDPGP